MATSRSRGSRLSLALPAGFELRRAACSYGYFLLAPYHWDTATRTQWATLTLRDDADNVASLATRGVTVAVRQSADRLVIHTDDRLDRGEQSQVRAQVRRMLRLDPRSDADVAAFHRLHPRARRAKFARLFRSATLWEDMVKTITGCNVSWPNTITMNRLLCEHYGPRDVEMPERAPRGFPTPGRLARVKPDVLQRRCKVGYRATRIVNLAKGIVTGEVDLDWLADPQREAGEVYDAMLNLDGFGPYAAANVLQLLGHYDHLPIDSETYRHYCRDTGTPRPSRLTPPRPDKELDPLIEAHFQRYRPYRFIAYWFDLWADYERRHGKAWTWVRETTGAAFTASRLKD